MGKKKFLNKKKAATFTLVYRDSAAGDDAAIPVRQFTRVDGGDSHVPGFSEHDPRSQAVDEYGEEEEEEEEDLNNFEDSMFADADEDGSGDEEEEVVRRSSRWRGRDAVVKPAASRLSENARRELIELGFPDDGYDYNQHMRNIDSGAAFVPSTRAAVPLRADIKAYDGSKVDVQAVNESTEAEADEVIELVSTHTRPVRKPLSKGGVLDADIIAALENSDGSQFDSTDELEDAFVIVASEGLEDRPCSLLDDGSTIRGGPSVGRASPKHGAGVEPDDEQLSDEDDNAEELPEISHGERPTRLLDEQFQTLALHEYDDYDNFELDEDDPLARGHADISQFSSVLTEFLNDKDVNLEKYETIAESRRTSATLECTNTFQDGENIGGKGANTNMVANEGLEDWMGKKTLELGSYESEGEMVSLVESEGGDEWDCETVVSTFSNLDNHPAKISVPGHPKRGPKLYELEKATVIHLGGKQHLPLDYLPKKVVAGKQGAKPVDKEVVLFAKVAGPRAGETLEEKKARKAAIKEHRREARQTKKTLKQYYREDSQRAQHGAATMGPNVVHLP